MWLLMSATEGNEEVKNGFLAVLVVLSDGKLNPAASPPLTALLPRTLCSRWMLVCLERSAQSHSPGTGLGGDRQQLRSATRMPPQHVAIDGLVGRPL